MNTSFFSRAVIAVTLLGTLATSPVLRADQPHMKAALEALQTAKAELEQAEADKGGHRVKAIEAVDRAINQTRMGIAAGM
jgi:hypothetical protein